MADSAPPPVELLEAVAALQSSVSALATAMVVVIETVQMALARIETPAPPATDGRRRHLDH